MPRKPSDAARLDALEREVRSLRAIVSKLQTVALNAAGQAQRVDDEAAVTRARMTIRPPPRPSRPPRS